MNHEIGFDMQRIERAGAIADEAVRSGSHPCALVAVANSTETIWTHLAPGADEVGRNSIFLLASITKPIIATAIMRLVEEGRLLLRLPVAHYIPEFGAYGKQHVTTWHLLTHTSGIEEARWLEELHSQDLTAADYLDAACRSYLHFEPGTRCEYCSLSFSLLGELISRLGGQPYPNYLREQIFTPLAMRDTAFRPLDTRRAAPVYDIGEPEALERFCKLEVPGGGLWSSADDLIAFGQAFLGGGRRGGYRLLGPAALELMTNNHTPGMVELIDGRPQPFNYGLGWGKPHSDGHVLASPRAYGHGGVTGTYLWIDPAWNMVCVFLTNRWGLETDTARRVLNAVYGALELL
jgi:CubicO group peptidase (beta-lactamase class C family)